MLLASMLVEHPAELRADMQRYYGLNLSQCGREFSPFHLAACASNLPMGSATLAATDERLGFTVLELAFLSFMGVDVGAKQDNELPDLEGLPADEFWEWYSKPREEVKDDSKHW